MGRPVTFVVGPQMENPQHELCNDERAEMRSLRSVIPSWPVAILCGTNVSLRQSALSLGFSRRAEKVIYSPLAGGDPGIVLQNGLIRLHDEVEIEPDRYYFPENEPSLFSWIAVQEYPVVIVLSLEKFVELPAVKAKAVKATTSAAYRGRWNGSEIVELELTKEIKGSMFAAS